MVERRARHSFAKSAGLEKKQPPRARYAVPADAHPADHPLAPLPILIYRFLFKAVLQRIPAEVAHTLAAEVLRVMTAIPGGRAALRRAFQAKDPSLQVEALGLTFPSPLGVAAGMDKSVNWFEGLGALGFGFVEVGTVTAQRQRGNPGVRVWRLIEDRAVLNRMGFPNPGARVAARRLRRRSGQTIVGANIGKSKAVPIEVAGPDYRASAYQLAPLADFLVLNVSSPNTPDLRQLQEAQPLRALIADVRDELRAVDAGVPLLLKIGPDLSNEEIDSIADLAVECKLDGIVATNTTIERDGLVSDPALWTHEGGISGAPLKARALAVLERLHERVANRLVLISVGGIETADDAWQRILAGATLVQAHTAFVYGGPLWPSRINRGLAERLRESGYSSLQDVVGTVTPDLPVRGADPNGGQKGDARPHRSSADGIGVERHENSAVI
jgi:dihydroorotate dehydrogenase